MVVFVETVLHCPAQRVWDEVRRCSLLVEVARPLVIVAPADAAEFPERWPEGTIRCKTYLLGFIPTGTRTIVMERIDPAAREIQSREHDALIRRWDHLVRVRSIADDQTLYSDEIAIDAGLLTLPVWLFAQWFYRHRQRKWRSIAKRLANA